MTLDPCVLAVGDRDGPAARAAEHLRGCGVVERRGARTSVHFRDPDGSRPEFIAYE